MVIVAITPAAQDRNFVTNIFFESDSLTCFKNAFFKQVTSPVKEAIIIIKKMINKSSGEFIFDVINIGARCN